MIISTTRAKVRDANVVNAYVIKPLDMTTTGVYRPRIGVLTVSPTIQYTSKLHHCHQSADHD